MSTAEDASVRRKVKRPADSKQRLKLEVERLTAELEQQRYENVKITDEAAAKLRSIRTTTLVECAKVARLKFAGGNLSVIGNLIADDINSLAQKETGND